VNVVGNLPDLRVGISGCVACPLHEGRTNAVPGDGPADAEVVFIGEAPGFYEDKQARPFVGQAGKFLDELLESVGWTREQVFITNVVKCRPPNNRDPLPIELDTCESNWLKPELGLVDPKIIVTLGRFSLTRLLPDERIGRARGKTLRWGDYTIFPIYHPAAALHQPQLRSVIMEDFQKLPGILRSIKARASGSDAPDDAGGPSSAPGEPEPQQLNLF
jgi:DNA polymerase